MKSIPCLSRTLLFSSLKIPQAAGLVFPSQKDAERVQKEKCCVSTQRYTKYVSMNFILVEVGRSYESFTVHFSALCRRYDTAVENEHLAELMKAVWRLNGLQGYDTTNIQPIYNLRSTRNPLGIHSESTRNPLGPLWITFPFCDSCKRFAQLSGCGVPLHGDDYNLRCI